jgi:hypothetical protein
MRLLLETYYTQRIKEGLRYFRHVVPITHLENNPDDIVYDLIKNDLNETPRMISESFIIHSTSWRYESSGEVYLTYLAYSDQIDFEKVDYHDLPFQDLELAHGRNIQKPRPSSINEINVISHALRHFAFLMHSKEGKRFRNVLKPETVDLFKKILSSLAGEFTSKEIV